MAPATFFWLRLKLCDIILSPLISFGYYLHEISFPSFHFQTMCVFKFKVSCLWTSYSWILFFVNTFYQSMFLLGSLLNLLSMFTHREGLDIDILFIFYMSYNFFVPHFIFYCPLCLVDFFVFDMFWSPSHFLLCVFYRIFLWLPWGLHIASKSYSDIF